MTIGLKFGIVCSSYKIPPTFLNNIALELDSLNMSKITLNGSKVSSWRNTVGSESFIQNTSGRQPTLSHGGITFTRSLSTDLKSSGFFYFDNVINGAGSKFTITLSVYLTNVSTAQYIFGQYGGTSSSRSLAVANNSGILQINIRSNNSVEVIQQVTDLTLQINTRYNIILSCDVTQSTGNETKVFVDGIERTLSSTTSDIVEVNSSASWNIGSAISSFFDGTIFSIFLFNRLYTPQDAIDLNDYLNDKYTYV